MDAFSVSTELFQTAVKTGWIVSDGQGGWQLTPAGRIALATTETLDMGVIPAPMM
jgi:hypothetical protein